VLINGPLIAGVPPGTTSESCHDPVGIRVGQRAKQDAVNNGKHGRHGGNSDRQCRQSVDREGALRRQRADNQAKIVQSSG
jgi:hypothetical protein